MIKVKWPISAKSAFAFMLAIPPPAANKPTARASQDMMPGAVVLSAWPSETLSGKITMVDPDRKLVVIEALDGVTFDMIVKAKTRIKASDQTNTIKDLTRDINRTVSVKFTPERRGDVATAIQITG